MTAALLERLGLLLSVDVRLLASVIERLGWTLLHSLWQFSLVALVLLVLRQLLAWCLPMHRQAQTRYLACATALGVMPVMAGVTFALVVPAEPPVSENVSERQSPLPSREATVWVEPIPQIVVNQEVTPFELDPPNQKTQHAGTVFQQARAPLAELPAAAFEPTASPLAAWQQSIEPWLAPIVCGWLCGVVLISLRPALGMWAVRRLRRRGILPVTPAIRELVVRLAAQLGVRHTIEVVQSTLVEVPAVIGWLKPVILLPASVATAMTPAQLETILAHELAHIRRHDYLANLGQMFVETVFFYHPAVWWVSHVMRTEREDCCDDLVVRVLGNRVDYVRALVAVDELRGTATPAAKANPLVPVLSATGGALMTRIRRIMGVPLERQTSWILTPLVLGLCLLSLMWLTLGSRVLPAAGVAEEIKVLEPPLTDPATLPQQALFAKGVAQPDEADPEKTTGPAAENPPALHPPLRDPAGANPFADNSPAKDVTERPADKPAADNAAPGGTPTLNLVNAKREVIGGTVSQAREGYDPEVKRFLNWDGTQKAGVTLKGLADGTHTLVANANLPNARVFTARVPMVNGAPLEREIAPLPAWYNRRDIETPETEVSVVQQGSHGTIEVLITNRSNDPFTFTRADFRLNNADLRVLLPFGMHKEGKVIKPHTTEKLRFDWAEIVRRGIWTNRSGESISEPSLPPDADGNVYFRLTVGISSALPVALPDPADVMLDLAQPAKPTKVDASRATLSGRILFDGERPVPKRITFPAPDIEAWARDGNRGNSPHRPSWTRIFFNDNYRDVVINDESLVVGPESGLANVLVWLRPSDRSQNLTSPKDAPGAKMVPLFIEKGRFAPHVLPLGSWQTLKLHNNESNPFNVMGQPLLNEAFNRMLKSNSGVALTLRGEKLPFKVASNLGGWMSAYVLPLDHPYFAATGEDGNFRIENIPPGEWELVFWHELSGWLPLDKFAKGKEKLTLVAGDKPLGELRVKAAVLVKEHFSEKLQRKLNLAFPNSRVTLVPEAKRLLVKGFAHDKEEASNILAIIHGELTNNPDDPRQLVDELGLEKATAPPRELPLGNFGGIPQRDQAPTPPPSTGGQASSGFRMGGARRGGPTPPPLIGGQVPDEGGWIDAEYGLQYRLRMPDARKLGAVVGEGRLTVTPDELPLLYVDLRNVGNNEQDLQFDLGLETHHTQHDLIIDGVEYRRNDQPWGGIDPLSPGAEPITLPFVLSEDWMFQPPPVQRPREPAFAKTGLKLTEGAHVVSLRINFHEFAYEPSEDPEGPPRKTLRNRGSRAIITHPFVLNVAPIKGIPLQTATQIGLENIRREMVAFPKFHSPKVSNNLRRLVRANQPAAGDQLIANVGDSKDLAPDTSSVIIATLWKDFSREQLEKFLKVEMTHFIQQRATYPAGVDAAIAVGPRFRGGYPGLPQDPPLTSETITTHFLDGKEVGEPFKYPLHTSISRWFRTGDLAVGRHTLRLVTEYKFDGGDEHYSGRVESPEYTFEVVPADVPDDLVAQPTEALEEQFRAAFEIREVPDERENPRKMPEAPKPGRKLYSSWGPGGWAPQIRMGGDKGGSLHMPAWQLFDKLPVDLCFRTEFKIEGTDVVIPGTEFVVFAGETRAFYFYPQNMDLDKLRKHADKDGFIPVRVKLIPSRPIALSHPRVQKYYGSEFTSDVVRLRVDYDPKLQQKPDE